MCVVSMVIDHTADVWRDRWRQFVPQHDFSPAEPLSPIITPAEIEEFHSLLNRAREYDRRHGQPDCELDEKRQKLMRLAEELGIADKISFV